MQAKIFKLFFAFLQKNGLLCYIISVDLLVFFSVAFYKSHVVTQRCADLKCYFSTQYFGTLTLTFSKHIAAVIGLIVSLGVTKILLIALQKGPVSLPLISCCFMYIITQNLQARKPPRWKCFENCGISVFMNFQYHQYQNRELVKLASCLQTNLNKVIPKTQTLFWSLLLLMAVGCDYLTMVFLRDNYYGNP